MWDDAPRRGPFPADHFALVRFRTPPTSTGGTNHALDGTVRRLDPDGTMRQPITSFTIRNGEGVVLVRDAPLIA